MRGCTRCRAFLFLAVLGASAPGVPRVSATEESEDSRARQALCANAQQIIREGFKNDDYIRFGADTDQLTGEVGYDAQIAFFGQRGDIAAAFRLSVLGTLAFPADDAFPSRLLRALSLVEYSERGTGVPIGDNWLTPLFAAAAVFPSDTPISQMSRCVHAAHLGVRREYRGQRAILETLLREPALVQQLRPKIFLATGNVLEQLNEPALAANAYARLVDEPLPPLEQANALLHATLLYLHSGDKPQAERMLANLAAAEPWARSCAVGAEQIDALLALRRGGRLAYWDRSVTWWPRWEKLLARVKVPVIGADTCAPVIANDLATRIALKPAIDTGDGPRFFLELRRVISAVRWLPGYAPQLGPLTYTVDRISPAAGAEFRSLIIAILDAARDELEPSSRREVDLWRAIARADAGEAHESLRLVQELRAQVGNDVDFAAQVARVHAVAAVAAHAEVREAADELGALLDAHQRLRDRADLVVILCDAYDALRDSDGLKRLLQREIDHPDVKAAARDHTRLVARLQLAQLEPEDDATEARLRPTGRTDPFDIEPKLIRRIEPAYASALRQRGLSGRVVLEVLVSATGHVVAVQVRQASHAVLGEFAAAAVAKWEFEPAQRDGKRVAARMQVPIFFPDKESGVAVATRTSAP